MYLTIMKPQALQQIAVLARGLWIVEGPEGFVLVIKAGKELILAAQQRRELKLYLAPYKAGETMGLTLLTACFDDPQSPLLIKTPLIPGDPLTEALQSFPDEFSVCFFDEHNRELFSCKAQAKLGQLRKELGTLSLIGADHWPKMYEQADRWFSLTTYEDDARAATVLLQEDLFPSDYLITDLTRQDFRGSKGFSNTQLERTEPGTFQELDIIYLLQRAYTSERIIHGPLKVSDGEELADVVVMGDEVTLLLQAKDSPNTPAMMNTTLERKRKVSGWRTHLPNSSIKGDGVRVFISGRDRPYRQDFHAPTKLLSQTIQSPSRPGMPATRSHDFQRSHSSRHQRQRNPQVATDFPGSITCNLAGFRSRKTGTKACNGRDGDHLATSGR